MNLIEFSKVDVIQIHFLHHDPLVVTTMIDNQIVYRRLINNGSFADILHADAFAKIGLGADKIRPTPESCLDSQGMRSPYKG